LLGRQIGARQTANSKPPEPIITMGQSETLSSQQSDHIYYTLFYGCTPLLRLSAITANRAIMLRVGNHILEPNQTRMF